MAVTCGEQLGLEPRSRAVLNTGDYPCDNHYIYRPSILDLTSEITEEEGLRKINNWQRAFLLPWEHRTSIHAWQATKAKLKRPGKSISEEAAFHINTSFHFDNFHYYAVSETGHIFRISPHCCIPIIQYHFSFTTNDTHIICLLQQQSHFFPSWNWVLWIKWHIIKVLYSVYTIPLRIYRKEACCFTTQAERELMKQPSDMGFWIEVKKKRLKFIVNENCGMLALRAF